MNTQWHKRPPAPFVHEEIHICKHAAEIRRVFSVMYPEKKHMSIETGIRKATARTKYDNEIDQKRLVEIAKSFICRMADNAASILKSYKRKFHTRPLDFTTVIRGVLRKEEEALVARGFPPRDLVNDDLLYHDIICELNRRSVVVNKRLAKERAKYHFKQPRLPKFRAPINKKKRRKKKKKVPKLLPQNVLVQPELGIKLD
ncbi:MAG: hypothetical protein WCF94_02165 [bacterium]